jgi:hypothetical protein
MIEQDRRRIKCTVTVIPQGYVGPTDDNPGSAFKLTAKGADFLGERGAGLNEA